MSRRAAGQAGDGLRRASPVLVLAIFALVLWLVRRQLRHVDLAAVGRALGELEHGRVAVAIALTAASYALLTCYDVLALRYLRRPLGYGRTAMASFIAYVFNMNLGLSVVGGTAVRYRLYSGWGLSAVEIGKIVGFCTSTTALGLLMVGGLVLLVGDAPANLAGWMPVLWVRPVGALLVSLAVAHVVVCARRRRPLRFRSWQLDLPSPQIASLQLALAGADLVLSGAVLYCLHPAGDVSFPVFIGVYLFALLAGVISHVPGGLGVFETVFLVALPTAAPESQVLATLVAFRAVYYLLPFAVGVALLAGYEAARQGRRITRVVSGFSRSVSAVAPRVLAFATFLGGTVLLASGATPADANHLHWLSEFVPLPLIEASHFFGGIAGACLLLMARGLQRRQNAAWLAATGLLAAGSLCSLAKGLDWEEALVLAGMCAALGVSRREFYRRSESRERFTPGWLAGIGVVLLAIVWLGWFSFKGVDYSADLWWRFEWNAEASRSLRATVGGAAVLMAAVISAGWRQPRARPGRPSASELEAAAAIANREPRSGAWLATSGDKSLLFSDSRQALIMFAVSGRSWVALGDPVGAPEEWLELTWRFRELCDAHGAWTVFFKASQAVLPLYVDLGLSVFKLGEEARVPLAGFSVADPKRDELRATRERLQADGCAFSVWTKTQVAGQLSTLRAVAAEWVRETGGEEKGFVVGRFHDDYVTRFPAAVVTRWGRAIAFAILQPSGNRRELSMDIPRCVADAPPGTMEYLAIEVSSHAAAQGFEWFNLGLAPAFGSDDGALAPMWNRLGSAIFDHTGSGADVAALRLMKDRFDPVWEPRYLVCPGGGLILPRVLGEVAALIGGTGTGHEPDVRAPAIRRLA